jgi:DNA-binding PadR family transcriptional regulator
MVGNIPNFTIIDLLRCLLRIEKPVSRSSLSESLDLGEGTVRSILDILKEKGFLNSNTRGHYLSENGKAFVKKIKDKMIIKEINITKLFINKKAAAIHLINPKKIEKAVILRDEAVKNGAEGALILKYNKTLEFYDSDYSEDFSDIEGKFNLSMDDILIIAYADSFKLSEYGALAAGMKLNNGLRDMMDLFH